MDNFLKKKSNVVLIAIFYSFLWGTAFPLVKICMEQFEAVDNMSKCLMAGIRFTLSGLLLTLFSAIKEPGFLKTDKQNGITVLIYGVFLALQYAFTYIGLSNINASAGAIFDQLCVFIIIIVSCAFLKNDKLTAAKIIGCIVGFAGIIMVNTDGLSFSFSFKGEGAMICAALLQAAAYFVAVFSANKLSAVKLVSLGQFIGGLLMICFALIFGGNIGAVTFAGVVVLIGLALISAIAYVLSLLPLKFFPASEIAVFNLLITVFGVIMSALVLGENIFRFNYFAALALVSAGIILVNLKVK